MEVLRVSLATGRVIRVPIDVRHYYPVLSFCSEVKSCK